MTILFYWRCEGTTLNATDDETVGDTTAAVTGPASLSATAVKLGTNGILAEAVGADARYSFALTASDLIKEATGSMGCWIRVVGPSLATGGVEFLLGRDSDQSESVQLFYSETGNVGMWTEQTDVIDSFLTTGNLFIVDAWFFVIARWEHAGNRRRVELYDTNGTLVDLAERLAAFSLPGTFGTFATGVRMGVVSAVTQTAYLDNIFISDTYEEPIQNNKSITSWTQWDGTPAEPPQLPGGPPATLVSIVRKMGP